MNLVHDGNCGMWEAVIGFLPGSLTTLCGFASVFHPRLEIYEKIVLFVHVNMLLRDRVKFH